MFDKARLEALFLSDYVIGRLRVIHVVVYRAFPLISENWGQCSELSQHAFYLGPPRVILGGMPILAVGASLLNRCNFLEYGLHIFLFCQSLPQPIPERLQLYLDSPFLLSHWNLLPDSVILPRPCPLYEPRYRILILPRTSSNANGLLLLEPLLGI